MFLPTAAKRVFAIGFPAILEAYLQNLLGVIDMVFIAHLGLVAVSAVGVTNIYGITFTGVFLGISASLSVFLSRSAGEHNLKRARSVVWHGLLLALLAGLILSFISVRFSRSLLHIMGAHGTLQTTALPYFEVVLGLAPLIALFTAQSAAFRAIGNTRTPLRVGIEMNVIHVALDYVLIYGLGPIPAYGLRGAAWSMVIVRLYALLRLWWKSRKVEAISLQLRDCRIYLDLLWKMIQFSLPTIAERLSMRFGQVIYFGLIVRMGVDVYATHNIAGTITAFSSTIGSGFATAATATMGQAIGQGQASLVKVYRHWSYVQASIGMTAVTLLLCLLSPWIGLLYTHHGHVLHLLFVILAIDVVSQPFLAAVLVDTAAIQVGGNSKYPMIVTTIGIWCVRTFGVYIFAWKLGLGLPAVWASIALDNAVRSLLFWHYRKTKLLIRPVSKQS